ITTLIKRKTYKRRYVSNLVTKKEGSSCEEGKTPAKRVRAERRCSYCSKIRHNSHTC
ncbi:uncharacterized protein M421DRAFT_71204, partial [Didymella exigua CBS 183.55]